MRAPSLLHDLVLAAAERAPASRALTHREHSFTYGELAGAVTRFSGALRSIGMTRGARVAIYIEQRAEAVIACFGASAAGGVMVPINPLLKPGQVAHILADCGVAILMTSAERLAGLQAALAECASIEHVILVDQPAPAAQRGSRNIHEWNTFLHAENVPGHRVIDADLAGIFYTSGSTGRPKGVMVSHRNLVCGAQSVSSYLENNADDVILAALPLSFDAGFSQLTTGFHSRARVVLLNYLLPKDMLEVVRTESVTGLTAVPPLFSQLVRTDWAAGTADSLRYLASTGGKMPRDVLASLQARAGQARVFLMYGLTEAFRSTYLPPPDLEGRPDSIGRAIPNAEVLVLRPDGSPCDANEPGELVHRGALVAMGYWNDPARTAERFRPLPNHAMSGLDGRPCPEIAVFSGDTVRRDEEGYLYFVGRSDEMIKTSGYRVSPTEVEDLIRATGLIGECAAFGLEDAALGQIIAIAATPSQGEPADTERLRKACREHMPRYMIPAMVSWFEDGLPRNPNGKIDRTALYARMNSVPATHHDKI
jgi:acyl-CoA ligase (AMP-forming) (exosortase A-associated)